MVVEIDSRSVEAARQWPWPRERFARALSNLRAAGAELVAFDVDFSARSDAQNDSALAAAIGLDPTTVVLPTFLQPGGLQENTPLAFLSRDALIASVNLPIDQDGLARHYVRGFLHNEHYHQSLAALVAGAPYGETSRFLIDYGINLDSIDRLSFHDVYRGTFNPERVRGRHILIGATALELGDEFATPARPAVPGVFIHALAYESLVQGRALMEIAPWLSLLAGLLTFALLWPRRETIDPTRWIALQATALTLLIGGPLIIQTIAPLSIDLSSALIAQALCFVATVQRELTHRAEELVRQREAYLHQVALHDPETQLLNRRAMIERLQHEFAVADGRIVVAIAIGVDRFATLRSAIGYFNANQVITKLAERIVKQSGQNDVYHLSTSVLGFVTTAANRDEFMKTHAGAIHGIESAINIDGQDIDVALRVGVALKGEDRENAEKLLENAVIALDQARLQRQRYVLFDAASFPDPRVQLALTSDIARGIERDEFSLVYQAKVCARDGRPVGAEALVRWRHPTHGDIPPDRFIQVAEETGAIDDLTRWVIRQAVEGQKTLREGSLDVPLSVNISGRLLADADFSAYVVDALANAGADIYLEITETTIIGDPESAFESISAFRNSGAKISIDDYGAGLSSLSYLKQIAADELKLDKSLIADITTSSRDRLILKSTIDLAHSLGMSVVAEGVENEMARAVLVGLGCDTIQGYLISRPLPLTDLIQRFGQEPELNPLHSAQFA